VASEPAGRASVFRLAQPALAQMLAAAEGVLAATGSAIILCPEWGVVSCSREPS
jgi:ArsR family transcriptional regulator, cadmium/lead-responsive transcriptional repressor